MPPEASAGLPSGPLRSRNRPARAARPLAPDRPALVASSLPPAPSVAIAQAAPGWGSRRTAAAPKDLSGGSAPRIERTLSLVLIAAVLVALGATVFIIVAPGEGEKFTEFYILGPTGKAADYPTEFMSRTPQTVIIGIGNHESRDITYTVETFAVESRFDDATNRSTVVSATLLDRFSVTVPDNRTVEQPYTFRIMDPDVNRLEFLLFAEAPPEEIPAGSLIGAGYRNLHLWLRVH
ncbi:DUF1616 domain-containing protein [Methanoculleus sp. 10]|uniref:DUF1616 domain-containing protein n=1 Tax=Methanoculleus sp. 10 TaxID=430615 RepID=UPI0025E9778D|nr:DUF1616 domain-containing protein [Methanoculleus sp. 10]